jgi:hypothetical protein
MKSQSAKRATSPPNRSSSPNHVMRSLPSGTGRGEQPSDQRAGTSPRRANSLPHEKGEKCGRSGTAQGIGRLPSLSDVWLADHGSTSKATGVFATPRRPSQVDCLGLISSMAAGAQWATWARETVDPSGAAPATRPALRLIAEPRHRQDRACRRRNVIRRSRSSRGS